MQPAANAPWGGWLAIVLTAVLAACTGLPATPAAAPDPAAIAAVLREHDWRLDQATSPAGSPIAALAAPAAAPVMLGFTANRVEIRGGCNLRGGEYTITATGQLQVGRMVSTMMACDRPLMDIDAALGRLLAEPLAVEASRGPPARLTLVAASGARLAFTGTRTAEARFGAPQVAFLEVAPKHVPCPGSTTPRCLEVRDRAFDTRGLPAGTPGPWRTLDVPIEGFTHAEGVRNVVRVKRYGNPAAGTPSAGVYVLDLIVESEIVSR